MADVIEAKDVKSTEKSTDSMAVPRRLAAAPDDDSERTDTDVPDDDNDDDDDNGADKESKAAIVPWRRRKVHTAADDDDDDDNVVVMEMVVRRPPQPVVKREKKMPPVINDPTISMDGILAKLKAQGLEYHRVMEDSIEIPIWKDMMNGDVPTIADMDGEMKWIDPEMIRNRANQALSRRKAYLTQPRVDVNYFTQPHVDVKVQYPYYGHYTGSVTGHALQEEFSELKPHTWRMLQWGQTLQKSSNHGIATRYDDHTMHMPAHSDKTQNLYGNSFIIDISIGATRQLVFEEKDTGKHVHTIELRNGSCFILGPKDNARCTHKVPELDTPCGPRISFILRAVANYITAKQLAKIKADHQKTQKKNADKPVKPRVKSGGGGGRGHANVSRKRKSTSPSSIIPPTANVEKKARINDNDDGDGNQGELTTTSSLPVIAAKAKAKAKGKAKQKLKNVVYISCGHPKWGPLSNEYPDVTSQRSWSQELKDETEKLLVQDGGTIMHEGLEFYSAANCYNWHIARLYGLDDLAESIQQLKSAAASHAMVRESALFAACKEKARRALPSGTPAAEVKAAEAKAMEAARFTRAALRGDNDAVRIAYMEKIVNTKFDTRDKPNLCALLLSTGTKSIIVKARRDISTEATADLLWTSKQRNELGKLLERRRAALAAEKAAITATAAAAAASAASATILNS